MYYLHFLHICVDISAQARQQLRISLDWELGFPVAYDDKHFESWAMRDADI